MEWVDEVPPKLSARENYLSTEIHKNDLEATFLEEGDLDTESAATTHLATQGPR